MRYSAGIIGIVCLGCVVAITACHADDTERLINRFYNDLADIVESHMDSPDLCVEAVNRYYDTHKDDVKKIREIMAEAMVRTVDAMAAHEEEFANMTEEEMRAYEERAQASCESGGVTGNRYAEVLGEFSSRHPRQGMAISMKTMELLGDIYQ